MTTQKCSQCSEEKPLSQFHKRADQYQKICKACRSENGKADYKSHGRERKTTTPVINKENVPALAEIVTSIESRLYAKASTYADHALEVDDLYGAMVEAILTKSDQKDSISTILHRADWAAYEFVRSRRLYLNRVDSVENDAEKFMTPSNVEEEIVQSEVSLELQSVIAQLPADYQKVISLLAIGMRKSMIAKEMHVSRSEITNKLRRIRSRLITLGVSYA